MFPNPSNIVSYRVVVCAVKIGLIIARQNESNFVKLVSAGHTIVLYKYQAYNMIQSRIIVVRSICNMYSNQAKC